MWFLLYNCIAVPVQYGFYQIARFFNKKIADGIAGRKNQRTHIREALSDVGNDRKRYLFHCVSVGEWEQSFPLIKEIKKNDPNCYVVVAFFSPSGYNFLKESADVDLKVYLPFDSYFRAKAFLKTIHPDLWIVAKHDIWPNHLFAARALHVNVILIDATLPENSLRVFPFFRSFFKSFYSSFSYMFPISELDKDRMLLLFPYPDKMMITGDTRFDQVYLRGQNALKSSEIQIFESENINVLIAGSTWPSDEKHLMPAIQKLLEIYQSLRVILVPHEPKERYLKGIEAVLEQANIPSKRLSKFLHNGHNGIRVTIVDSVGLLAKLYTKSDIAYVGGSFGPGVHNVMEPGILGKPVLFGPNYLNSFEASELILCGGGFLVRSSSDITDIVSDFLDNNAKRTEAGKKAQELIQNNLGATDKIYHQLRELYDFIPKNNSN